MVKVNWVKFGGIDFKPITQHPKTKDTVYTSESGHILKLSPDVNLLTEAQTQNDLFHMGCSVPQVLYLGKMGELYYMVQSKVGSLSGREFIQGFKQIKDARHSEVLNLVRHGAVNLLRYGILHNDFHWSNIRFDTGTVPPKLYIIDFGMSKQIDPELCTKLYGCFTTNLAQYVRLDEFTGVLMRHPDVVHSVPVSRQWAIIMLSYLHHYKYCNKNACWYDYLSCWVESPSTFKGFTGEDRRLMITCTNRNLTGLSFNKLVVYCERFGSIPTETGMKYTRYDVAHITQNVDFQIDGSHPEVPIRELPLIEFMQPGHFVVLISDQGNFPAQVVGINENETMHIILNNGKDFPEVSQQFIECYVIVNRAGSYTIAKVLYIEEVIDGKVVMVEFSDKTLDLYKYDDVRQITSFEQFSLPFVGGKRKRKKTKRKKSNRKRKTRR
jgi:hypothetical protein